MEQRHILILGGTSEARQIAGELASYPRLRVTTSLAGRTADPALPPGESRIGGFGGPEGLAAWMIEQKVDVLIDATHPFAARISANAVAAAQRARVSLVSFERRPWIEVDGDHWIHVGTIAEAAERLGSARRRVFLAVGRQELRAFESFPFHDYVVRTVDAADGVLTGATKILARGPFDVVAEGRLLEEQRIEVVVAKNSGGDATYGKLEAARRLGLPVIMVRRPAPPRGDAHTTVEGVVSAVHQLLAGAHERGE